MNYKSYRGYIINKYGSVFTNGSKHKFARDIDKLLAAHETHINSLWLGRNREVIPEVKEPSELTREDILEDDFARFIYRYKMGTLEQSIKYLMSKRMKDYDKALGILRLVKNFGGWHSLSVIPEEMLMETWNLIEGMKNVELHPEQDGLFRVI